MTAKPSPKIAKQHEHLPLVPQAILKKRHSLDEAAREQKVSARALRQGKNRKSSTKGGAKNKNDAESRPTRRLYVKKPETIVARARMRRNHEKRYRRVLAKGMQTRASNKPQFATKEIPHDDDDDHNDDAAMVDEEMPNNNSKKAVTVIKYQTNSVGASMVFVIRIRDHIGCPPDVKKLLHSLRLRDLHDGVFVRYDDQHRKLLHLVEPWVVYGPPSRAAVVDLIERRGYGRKVEVNNKQKEKDDSESKKSLKKGNPPPRRVPLSDNVVIEQALGECCNILCKEDLVEELCQSQPSKHFEHVAQFLWPFRLTDSKTPIERRVLKIKDGKDEYGDRGEAITEYIQNVL